MLQPRCHLCLYMVLLFPSLRLLNGQWDWLVEFDGNVVLDLLRVGLSVGDGMSGACCFLEASFFLKFAESWMEVPSWTSTRLNLCYSWIGAIMRAVAKMALAASATN